VNVGGFFRRLLFYFRRRRLEEELDEEIQFHLAMSSRRQFWERYLAE